MSLFEEAFQMYCDSKSVSSTPVHPLPGLRTEPRLATPRQKVAVVLAALALLAGCGGVEMDDVAQPEAPVASQVTTVEVQDAGPAKAFHAPVYEFQGVKKPERCAGPGDSCETDSDCCGVTDTCHQSTHQCGC